MKKLFSKFMTFVFVICASVAMFACGAQKDVNIKSIELVGEMPNYIVIGEFDQANIKILVRYEDNSSEEINVTTSMIAEADRHYLNEQGVYDVTILFKGETTVLRVKMVEKSAVNLVKFYDGNGQFIMSELVLDGEDAVCPNASWLAMNGYNFVGWDRLTTNVTEDISVYGIYTKIEDTVNEQIFKEKLENAYTYLVQHDHVSSFITTEQESLTKVNVDYDYNDGKFIAQMEDGESFAEVTSEGLTSYYYDEVDNSEILQYVYANKYSGEGIEQALLNTALIGDPDDIILADIITSENTLCTSALYGNRNIYTAINEVTDENTRIKVTILYDDEKILNIKHEHTSLTGGESWISYIYIDYTTLALQNYDFASKIDIEAYKTKLENARTTLLSTDWTARLNAETVTHTANESTIVGNDNYVFDLVIPTFNNNACGGGVSISRDDNTIELVWFTEGSECIYTFSGNELVSVSVQGDGIVYIIEF